jgi:hypothetical protein
VPGVRFGFTPLLADRFCAADEPSRRQLLDWGVPAERLLVTGSPSLDQLQNPIAAATKQSILPGGIPPNAERVFLLLASTPARDERPDAVAFHLTTRTDAELIEGVCRAIADVPGARLLIKPHPRDIQARSWQPALTRYPQLRAEIAVEPRLERLLPDVDIVLSCGSTGGIEAASLGWPVIQLLPRGSGDLLPAEWWGLLGTARSEIELRELLRRSKSASVRHEPARRHAVSQSTVAQRIADLLLSEIVDQRTSRCGVDNGSNTKHDSRAGPRFETTATANSSLSTPGSAARC